MRDLNLVQGSQEWISARAKYKTASEAPAMMGVSNYMTRNQLIAQKATGIIPEHDASTQARFDAGHIAEGLCRPLAESIIGEPLYPIVGADDTDTYLASSDGATMLLDTGWEHKLPNAKLLESVKAGVVPETHKWQLVHQALVFGFKRILFSVSDGSQDNHHYCWFEPSEDEKERLVAGWRQFDIDIASFVPQQPAQTFAGEAPKTLPALRIEVSGAVTASNLSEFKARAIEVFNGIKTSLETDEDFVNADKTTKWCKEVEDRLEAAKQHALSQTASIDELFRTVDEIKEEARQKRLALEKLVKQRKESIRIEMVEAARKQFSAHVAALQSEISGVLLVVAQPDFGGAIKGLKTLVSIQNAIDTKLAAAKIESNTYAKEVREKLNWCRENAAGHSALFPDLQQIIVKPFEDFALTISSRIEQSKKDEEARIERIRAEEREKAKRESEAITAIATHANSPSPVQNQAAAIATVPESSKEENQATGNPVQQTIKLGEICLRLGFTVSSDFLAQLGYRPVATEKNAKLYGEFQWKGICSALIQHISNASTSLKQAA